MSVRKWSSAEMKVDLIWFLLMHTFSNS